VQNSTGGFAPAPGWPGQRTARLRALWADDRGPGGGDGTTIRLTTGGGTWQALDVGVTNDQIAGGLRDPEGALWSRTTAHMWTVPPGTARATNVTADLPTGYDMVDSAMAMAIGPRGGILVGTDAGLAYRDGDHWHLIDRSAGMPAAATRTI